mmetsp:Transcript_792/g.2436  ORF Transcript_792/g.2436 Transcript_792/m.2436 type:complete len:350 (+) Transcript_792:158-1207(+)
MDASRLTELSHETHEYLGILDDETASAECLAAGTEHELPLLTLDGAVLIPGELLPLWLRNPADKWIIESARKSDSRLFAVVQQNWQHGIPVLCAVGCTAEIKRMRQVQGGETNVVARGCQRVSVLAVTGRTARVRVLSDCEPRRMDAAVRGGGAAFAPWVLRRFDAHELAAVARLLLHKLSPERTEVCTGGPVGLSFWLCHALPLDASARQRLLEAPHAAARLHEQVAIMTRLDLRCTGCSSQLCTASKVLASAAGLFVNPYGAVHDMVIVSEIMNTETLGRPTKEASWFPGYAWQILYCPTCEEHLGWKFTQADTSCRTGLPKQFWGIRRSSLLASGLYESLHTSDDS